MESPLRRVVLMHDSQNHQKPRRDKKAWHFTCYRVVMRIYIIYIYVYWRTIHQNTWEIIKYIYAK